MNGGLKNIDNVVRNEPQTKPEPVKEVFSSAQITQNGPTSDRVLLAWKGQNFDYKEKGVRWFLLMSLAVLTIVGYLAWQKDWFTIAIMVIVTGILIWYTKTVRPAAQDYSLTSFGINISDNYYPYAEIHSFWIVYNQDIQKLYFVQTKKYLPSVIMDISNVSPERVRAVLSRRIPEQVGRGENLLDKTVRLLRL